MKQFLMIAIATLGVSMVAHAGFLIEPAVGMQGLSSTAYQYKNGGTTFSYTEASYPVMLRVAYMAANGFQFGINGGVYMSGAFTGVTPTTSVNDTFTRTSAAAIVGYENPKGFRVWVGYDFMNNITNTPATTASANDLTSVTNTGMQAGFGWRFHNHIAINALYDVPGTPTAYQTKTNTNVQTSAVTSFTDSALLSIMVAFPFGGGKM